MGPRDGVEREVPGREPRVLPRVGHGEHVERVEVPPPAVAPGRVAGRRWRLPGSPSSQRRTRYGYICLLHTSPAHAWRSNLHRLGVDAVAARARRRTRRPRPAARRRRRRTPRPSQSGAAPRGRRSRRRSSARPPAGTVRWYHQAAFVPRCSGFTVAAPDTTWSLIPSFGYGVIGVGAEDAGRVRLVVAEQRPRRRAVRPRTRPRGGSRRAGRARRRPRRRRRRPRTGVSSSPHAPRVAEPQRRQHVELASSGPWFSTATRTSTSVGDALA